MKSNSLLLKKVFEEWIELFRSERQWIDFTFKWDGFDMIDNMSRYVYCPNYSKMNY